MRVSLSLHDIIDKLGGLIADDANIEIVRVGSLEFAQNGAIAFFNDTKYAAQLAATQASAVILRPEHRQLTSLPKIVTDNPYAYFARVSQLLNPVAAPTNGCHPTAVIDANSHIPSTASIGAHVVIGRNVTLGEHVIIGAGTIVEDNAQIGDHTRLESSVTIKHGTQIGAHCHLFSGSVIGNDGFGYAPQAGSWVKIPQVGRAIIQDHVDIGANTTIDRGAIDDTVIEEGVKIDNLVQIAHNCRIGAHTVIAGCVGIAGSARIGRHCKIGGAAMILGHLSIADDVTISPGSMITRSIQKPGTYTALMPFQEHKEWLKTAANVRHLDMLTDKIKQLELELKKLQNKT
jgi:UDP-3-O-[3-hydroxymyristoyl] glucosamine N-acyltransferase